MLMLGGCDRKPASVTKATPIPVAPAELIGRNLLLNGDAEAVQTTQNPNEKPAPADWSRTNDVVAQEYSGSRGEWSPEEPSCPDARKRVFRFGLAINETTKSILQSVDLRPLGAEIDTGTLEIAMGGWFGGWVGGDASVRLEIDFKDATGKVLGTATTEAPDPATLPKAGIARAAMVKAIANALVPAGTRGLDVRLTALRPTGRADTIAVGAADNLSVVVRMKE